MDHAEPLKIFSDSYAKILASTNYILILNGVLLTGFIMIITSDLTVQSSQLNLDKILHLSEWIVNLLQYVLHLSTILSIGASVLYGIGAINAGIFPALQKGKDIISEVKSRENVGIKLYSAASKWLAAGIIGLYSMTLIRFGGVSFALIVFMSSIGYLFLFIHKYKLFSKF